LPSSIGAPGLYCLKGSLTSASDGVTIKPSDVVLDLNGYSLIGSGAGVGISAQDQKNVVVKNGAVKNFVYGVVLTTTGLTEAGVVEHMLVQGTTVGIEADGQGMAARHTE
jgi:hypothetical protein